MPITAPGGRRHDLLDPRLLEHHVLPGEAQDAPAVRPEIVVSPTVVDEISAAPVVREALGLQHQSPLGIPEVDVDDATREPDLQLRLEAPHAGLEDEPPKAGLEGVAGTMVGLERHPDETAPRRTGRRAGSVEEFRSLDEPLCERAVRDGERPGSGMVAAQSRTARSTGVTPRSP